MGVQAFTGVSGGSCGGKQVTDLITANDATPNAICSGHIQGQAADQGCHLAFKDEPAGARWNAWRPQCRQCKGGVAWIGFKLKAPGFVKCFQVFGGRDSLGDTYRSNSLGQGFADGKTYCEAQIDNVVFQNGAKNPCFEMCVFPTQHLPLL